jgi:hypothetical protein
MKIIINKDNIDKFKSTVNGILKGSLEEYKRLATEEFGLGEMSEIRIIETVNKLEVTKCDIKSKKIYVDVFLNHEEYDETDLEGLLDSIEYDVQTWISSFELIYNIIICK